MTASSPPPYSPPAVDFLARTHLPFIDGDFRDCGAEGEIAAVDPATGAAVARFPDCGAAAVDRAVVAATRALGGPWSRLRPVERERLLLALADRLAADGTLLAELTSIESGKSLGLAQAVEVGASVDWLRYMAGWSTKIEGQTLDLSIAVPENSRHFAATLREPVGVVGAIVPWNFPLLMAIWKVAPALACGCTVVLKPAEETSLSALRLAELAAEVGLPPGVLNVVTGRGASAGAALARHPGVNKLTFTGSTEVGKQIGHAAVDNMARFTLELGGKSPMIIMDDVEEGLEPLMAGLGMFFNQGQVCTTATRILIARPIYERTLANLAAVADSMTMGSGRDPLAQINPVVSARQLERVQGFIERAKAGGATLAAGNRAVPEQGYFVPPTIIHGAGPGSEIVQEEVFGPVVAALPFDTLDDALALANDTRYGLSASIWTRDLGKALSTARAVKAGTVWINTHNTVDPNLPFGGVKQSGIGREHGRAVLDSYLETKSLVIRY